LTTHSGLDFEPAISPHGDAIAFVSDRSGAFEIYVRALTGIASEVPLTSDGAQNVQPAWSPDGASIAFHSNQKGGIWIVPARGGNPRQIATVGSRPAWAPDGRRIAFQSDEHPDVAPDGYSAQNGSTLWLVDVDGGHLEPLTRSGHPVGGHAAPSWSPDGRFVAFSVFEAATDGGIWTVQTDTRDTRLLLPGPGFVDSAFAPDGSALYIAGGEAFIVRVPLDPRTATATGPPTTIPVSGVQSVRDLSIAPDGRRLVFAAPAVNSQIWAQPIDRSGSATSEARALTSDTSRRNSFPAISPDGSKVAYMSTRRGELPNVWVMGIDGRNGIQVTPDDTAEFKPDWLPDGKRIAYVSSRNNRRGLWIGDVDSRREQLLFDTSSVRLPSGTSRLSGRLGELDPSPSMTKIAFSLFAGPAGRRVIYVATPDPFVPRALTDPATSVGYPFWSPDERRLVVEIKDGSSTDAAVIDVDTGRLRRLTHEVGQTWPRSFSPDGQRIAAAVLREGVWSLRWIDVATSRQGTITPASPPRVYVRYPEWSPKSDVVLYERGESTGNIWLLDINRT
jgi:Tol biopolymer transport system component